MEHFLNCSLDCSPWINAWEPDQRQVFCCPSIKFLTMPP